MSMGTDRVGDDQKNVFLGAADQKMLLGTVDQKMCLGTTKGALFGDDLGAGINR